jgi:hypothetical protein
VTKRCPRCGETKSAEDFYVKKDGKLQSYCRPCNKAAATEWNKNNRGRRREYMRGWTKRNPERVRTSKLKTTYGLSAQDYRSLRVSQNERCAACGDILQGGRREAVDHCHETGRVRSILCCWCNKALGHAKEDPNRLRALATYIEEVMK